MTMTNNTLSHRLTSAMKDAGLTQASLAKRAGISQSAVQKLTSGEAKASKHIVTLASILSVDPTWLTTGSTTRPVDAWDDDTVMDDDDVNVPFFREIRLAAGHGEEKTIQLNHGRKLHFSRRTLKKVGVKPQDAACVTVSGSSMTPVMPHGCTVGIDTSITVVVDGDIYAIGQHNHLRVKIVYQMPWGGYRLRSFNSSEWPDETYDEDDLTILGRVFWYSALI